MFSLHESWHDSGHCKRISVNLPLLIFHHHNLQTEQNTNRNIGLNYYKCAWILHRDCKFMSCMISQSILEDLCTASQLNEADKKLWDGSMKQWRLHGNLLYVRRQVILLGGPWGNQLWGRISWFSSLCSYICMEEGRFHGSILYVGTFHGETSCVVRFVGYLSWFSSLFFYFCMKQCRFHGNILYVGA